VRSLRDVSRSRLVGCGNYAIAFIGVYGEVRSHYLLSNRLESSAKINSTVIKRKAMSNQELEQQLLSLDLAERIRILQLLAQSLTVPSSQPTPTPDELDLISDRSPQHPLRKIPLTIPPDFDEPMPELWDALGQ
jgi:hypothetical protein